MVPAQVCREIRREFLPLYLQNLQLRVRLTDFDRFKMTFTSSATKCKGELQVIVNPKRADFDITPEIQFCRRNQDLRATAVYTFVTRFPGYLGQRSRYHRSWEDHIIATALLRTIQPTTRAHANWHEYLDQAVFRIDICDITTNDYDKIVTFFVDRDETKLLATRSSEGENEMPGTSYQEKDDSESSSSNADDGIELWARNSGFDGCVLWADSKEDVYRFKVVSLGRDAEGRCTSWTMETSPR